MSHPVAETCGVSISAMQAIRESKKSQGAKRRSSRLLKRRTMHCCNVAWIVNPTVKLREKEKALLLAISAF